MGHPLCGCASGRLGHPPTFSILIWHFYLVIFDPMVYPMDTAWFDGKIPADHYRHSRPEYFRALERAHLVELPSEPSDYRDEQGAADDHPSYKPGD